MSKEKQKDNEAQKEPQTEAQQEKESPKHSGQKNKDAKKASEPDTDTKEPQSDPLEELQQKFNELQDRLLRVSAEYENYRRRTAKEKADLMAYGSEKTLAAILPVIDDLELAFANTEAAEDVAAMRQGLELIVQKFVAFLKNQGVEPIEVVGKPFDMHSQQAIAMLPASDPSQKGIVLDCTKKGYMLHDKVLRYADVVVGE